VGPSRDREKSYYLANVPLKQSISAEKEVHGSSGDRENLSRLAKVPLIWGPSYREYTVFF